MLSIIGLIMRTHVVEKRSQAASVFLQARQIGPEVQAPNKEREDGEEASEQSEIMEPEKQEDKSEKVL